MKAQKLYNGVLGLGSWVSGQWSVVMGHGSVGHGSVVSGQGSSVLSPFRTGSSDLSPFTFPHGRPRPFTFHLSPFTFYLLICLMFSVQCFANVEKKKSVIKIFDMAAKDNLLIDNQFGKVNVSLWDKNEVRIDITVSVKSANEDRAQRYLNSVEIVDKRAGDQISMRTIINKQESSSGWNWPWSSKESDNQIQIDYTVSMPKNNALTVINRFGNTNIPSFKAPLAVTSKYGNFTANDLMGSKNDIDVSYGKADIQQMSNGKIDVSYSTLNLESIKTLTIVNRFGKLKIGQVEKIDGRISYSSGRIGLLKESCNLKLDFSGGFRIDQVATSTENVDIQASYSSVNVPVENSDCNFDVTVTHGGFNYGNSRKVIFTQNDDDRKDDQRGYRSTKQYIGKMGNGGNMRIKVVSKFGEVSLK